MNIKGNIFPDLKRYDYLRFDFGILKNNELSCVCEFQGKQHYQPIDYFGGEEGLIDTQERDQMKVDYVTKNNIPLIVIPYWDFDNIEEILDKELSQFN